MTKEKEVKKGTMSSSDQILPIFCSMAGRTCRYRSGEEGKLIATDFSAVHTYLALVCSWCGMLDTDQRLRTVPLAVRLWAN